ncbi:MAG: ABC transporter ATPase [Flavobacteriaceae bacterium]
MLVSFDKLPLNSRVWIYSSNRKFIQKEIISIRKDLENFLSNWTSHNQNLETGFELRYDRFIIIAVNQEINNASGCSIDNCVRFIKKLENKYEVDLLDKMNVIYKQDKHLYHKKLNEFISMYKNNSVSLNTIVFNNLVNTVGEYKLKWEVTAKESWHNRFMN